jgi:hypothetical protein
MYGIASEQQVRDIVSAHTVTASGAFDLLAQQRY